MSNNLKNDSLGCRHYILLTEQGLFQTGHEQKIIRGNVTTLLCSGTTREGDYVCKLTHSSYTTPTHYLLPTYDPKEINLIFYLDNRSSHCIFMTDMTSRVWFFILPTNGISKATINDIRNQGHKKWSWSGYYQTYLDPCDPLGTALGGKMAPSRC